MAFLTNDQSTAITGGLEGLSFAGSIYSAFQSSSAAKAKYNSEKQIASLEMQADQVRRQAMEMSARRQQLQTIRTAQQARAMALSTAVGQGAQFSSSAESGQAQTNAQAAYANLGVSQNLQYGEQLFNINSMIDTQKIAEADAESKLASSQGLNSLFSSAGKAIPDIMKLATLFP